MLQPAVPIIGKADMIQLNILCISIYQGFQLRHKMMIPPLPVGIKELEHQHLVKQLMRHFPFNPFGKFGQGNKVPKIEPGIMSAAVSQVG